MLSEAKPEDSVSPEGDVEQVQSKEVRCPAMPCDALQCPAMPCDTLRSLAMPCALRPAMLHEQATARRSVLRSPGRHSPPHAPRRPFPPPSPPSCPSLSHAYPHRACPHGRPESSWASRPPRSLTERPRRPERYTSSWMATEVVNMGSWGRVHWTPSATSHALLVSQFQLLGYL